MRALMIVGVMAGIAQAGPTKYTPPMVQAASTPTARSGKAEVKGRVVHEDGTPVPFFGLMIQKRGAPTYMSSPLAVRDAKGAFHFDGIEAGTWKIVLIGPGFIGAATGDLTLVDGTSVDAGTITVKPGNQVSGTVTEQGKPVAGAKVCAEQQRGGLSMGGMLVDGKPLADPELLEIRDGKQCALTDKRGRYVVRGIPDATPSMMNKPLVLGVRVERGAKAGSSSVGFGKAMTLDLAIN